MREARRDRQGRRKGAQEGPHQQQLADARVDGQLCEVPPQRGEAFVFFFVFIVIVVVPLPRERF